MNMRGYSNPLRSMERTMGAGYPSKEFRDPGMGGLGSLHRTMPHLMRFSATPHFQGGGPVDLTPTQLAMLRAGQLSPAQVAQMQQIGFNPDTGTPQRFQAGGAYSNPVGQMIAATTPNNFNPDPRFRQMLSAIRATPMTNPSLRTISTGTPFAYQQGGAAPDPEEAMEPDNQMSPEEQKEHQIVMDALAALDGQNPDAEAALARFIDTFGPRALADLEQLLEQQHQAQGQGEEEEDEEEDDSGGPGDGSEQGPTQDIENELAEAGGGLLRGHGTGQSDEIEGRTASGRPVLLSDGEYVIDAPTVAALGDGSTNAGARRLDALRKQIRRDSYGSDKQAKPMARGGKSMVLRIP
jgi:hypothetical protein